MITVHIGDMTAMECIAPTPMRRLTSTMAAMVLTFNRFKEAAGETFVMRGKRMHPFIINRKHDRKAMGDFAAKDSDVEKWRM